MHPNPVWDTVRKPADSELVLKPGNRDSGGRNGIWRKNTLGCMAGLTLTLICVAAAVMQWDVWVRMDQQLTKSLVRSGIKRV